MTYVGADIRLVVFHLEPSRGVCASSVERRERDDLRLPVGGW